MVIILDGLTQNILHARRKISHFLSDFKFLTSIDLDKRLKQIKLPILLYTCAPFSVLPFNISTTEEDVALTLTSPLDSPV